MSWYRTGTITLTNGTNIVTSIGSSFLANVKVGDMLIDPLMDVYEISAVSSDNTLQLAGNYPGVSYTGVNWSIAPTSVNLKNLASQVSDLVVIYQDIPAVATTAQAAATQALFQANAANTSAAQADTSATNALASAQSAATSSTSAGTALTNATTQASNASASAASALASKNAAGTSETNAAASATSASDSASAAVTAKNAAEAAAASVSGASVTSVNTRTGAVTLSKTDVGLANVDNLSRASILASPAITGTPTGITKTHVGLANVDNTSDALKPISTATQNALDLKATLLSAALTGTPTAPNVAAGTRSTRIATMQSFADEFASLKSATGYQKLPSGLIIQWGTSVTNSGFDAAIGLPVAWPNGLLAAAGTIPSTSVGYIAVVQAYSAAPLINLLISCWSPNFTRQTASINWIAIGW